MGSTLTRLLVHIVFATKGRAPLLPVELALPLYRYFGTVARNAGCGLHAAGGVEDHAHLLVRLNPSVPLAHLVGALKANSSRKLRELGSPSFAWQTGYAAFSVGASAEPRVRSYILGQERHHRSRTFHQELEELFRRHQITPDPRFFGE